MVKYLFLSLVDLLLSGVQHCVRLALAGKNAVLRLWDDVRARELAYEGLDYLLARFRSLEMYLNGVRTRLRYRVFFDQLTVPMAERYRRLRKG